jgi:hypothetical protein
VAKTFIGVVATVASWRALEETEKSSARAADAVDGFGARNTLGKSDGAQKRGWKVQIHQQPVHEYYESHNRLLRL